MRNSPKHIGRGTGRRRRFLPAVWALSAAGVVVVALGVSGSLSGFTASIDNNANSAGSGSIVMEEQSGTGANLVTCYSTATGSTVSTNAGTCSINKLGGDLVLTPTTAPVSVSVTITNVGTAPASSFTLAPGGCTATAQTSTYVGTDTSGFCGEVDLAIYDSTSDTCIVGPAGATTAATCLPSSANTLASLGSTVITLPAPVAPGASDSFTFETQINSAASNADMGLEVSDNLTWTFNA